MSHVAEQFSWVPYPTTLPRCPLPIVSCFVSTSPQTILFWVLGKSPLLGPWRGPLFLQQLVTMKGLLFLLWLISGLLRVLQNHFACLRPDPAATTGTRLSLVSSWHGQLARVPRPGKEREIFWPLLSHPSFQPILSYSIFSCPLVLDTGIWPKGLSLSWGSETDHLLLAEKLNFSSGWADFQSSFSGGLGKCPVMPGYLQVAGDVCKATPFFPLSLPHS